MRRISGMGVFCIALTMAVLSVPGAEAKKAAELAPGPIPTQLLNGKKVFISYLESDADPGAPNLTYNEFYALMKSWGKYELVTGPRRRGSGFRDLLCKWSFGFPAASVDRGFQNAFCAVAIHPARAKLVPGNV